MFLIVKFKLYLVILSLSSSHVYVYLLYISLLSISTLYILNVFFEKKETKLSIALRRTNDHKTCHQIFDIGPTVLRAPPVKKITVETVVGYTAHP